MMTWGGATPVIAVAGIFDLLRMFFEMFWFFGPAIAGLYCTSKASDLVGNLWGLTATLCAGVAGAAGAAVSEVTIPFGTIMAMAVGLLGFLTLGLWILMKNARIFKANATGALWFIGSLGVSEIPIIGTIPAFSITLWKLYKTQIRIEGAARKKWEKEHAQEAAMQVRQRQQQAAQLMQARTDQMEQQEAANDERYDDAANDDQYTPEIEKAA
jgi:hypothetical protein